MARDKMPAKVKTQVISPAPNGCYYAKIQLDWLPMPSDLLTKLGWSEGEEMEIMPIFGHQIVVRRKGALKDDPV